MLSIPPSSTLFPYTTLFRSTPYRACGPIFVRERVPSHPWSVGEIPETIRRRLLSVRAYDADGMMLGADVVECRDLERSEEHTSELQSRLHLVCRLLLEKKKY